jgi:hypothetical protein
MVKMPKIESTTRKIAQNGGNRFFSFLTSLPDVLEFRAEPISTILQYKYRLYNTGTGYTITCFGLSKPTPTVGHYAQVDMLGLWYNPSTSGRKRAWSHQVGETK